MLEQINRKDLTRFKNKVKHAWGCWIWQGHRNSGGYGSFSVKSKAVSAHRFSYMAFKGPIPEGMTIDHLCRKKSCVNPKHLEAVPCREGHWHYIFVPVYAEKKKYRARVPLDWTPDRVTALYAQKVYDTSFEWLGHSYTPPKEHLYWWQTERDAAVKSGILNIFLTNYASTPEESFQHTNVSAFPPEVLENLRRRAKIAKAFEFIPNARTNQ